jgi:uncharacterized protein YgbK (DUF1537 family)
MNLTGTNCFSIEFARIRILKDHPYTQHYFKLRIADVMRKAGLRRGVIAGGDTSGHAAMTLGIYALTALAPIAPGSALCRAHSDDPAHADLEMALKGGQMGAVDYFRAAKQGCG